MQRMTRPGVQEGHHEMDETMIDTARKCLHAAYSGTLDFPTIVHALIDAGFEGYDVDYRRGTSTYFHANGESVQLALPKSEAPVAAAFNGGRCVRR